MGKVYEKPPVIEAICEFRFEPSQPWDWTVPGLMYDKIKEEFPKKRQQNLMQLELQIGAPQNTQELHGGVARMQFLREDEKALIQVGPDLLVINQIKPYPNWGTFRKMIVNALGVYREVANSKGFQRIGLRYINRIETQESRIQIEDYLLAVPEVPDPIPQLFATWLQRVEIPFEQANGVLILQSGSIHEREQAGVAFLLDLDFVTLLPNAVPVDSAIEWVDRAHDKIEEAFESCLTNKSRAIFGAVKENIQNG